MKVFAVLLMILMAGCTRIAPDAGHEVVLIVKPWFFGDGGVYPTPIATGSEYVAFSTQAVDVNMQPIKAEAEMQDTSTADGIPITFHAIMTVQVTDSVTLVREFGPSWYTNNVEEQFKQMIRHAVRQHGMNDIVTSVTVMDQIDTEIRDKLAAYIVEKGLPLKLITLTVGRANPPDAVKTQRIDTAQQEQRIQTEQKKKLAEDVRKMAEESRAAADNAYLKAMQMSPEQYIQLENIKMMRDVCDGGKCTFITAGVSPVYNLGK